MAPWYSLPQHSVLSRQSTPPFFLPGASSLAFAYGLPSGEPSSMLAEELYRLHNDAVRYRCQKRAVCNCAGWFDFVGLKLLHWRTSDPLLSGAATSTKCLSERVSLPAASSPMHFDTMPMHAEAISGVMFMFADACATITSRLLSISVLKLPAEPVCCKHVSHSHRVWTKCKNAIAAYQMGR